MKAVKRYFFFLTPLWSLSFSNEDQKRKDKTKAINIFSFAHYSLFNDFNCWASWVLKSPQCHQHTGSRVVFLFNYNRIQFKIMLGEVYSRYKQPKPLPEGTQSLHVAFYKPNEKWFDLQLLTAKTNQYLHLNFL